MLQATKKVEYFCKTDKRLVLQRVFLNAKENKQTNKQDEQTDKQDEQTDKETSKQVEQTDGETEKEMQTTEGGETEAETDSS